jgi:nucleoside-diphosphate-sugar epimerase
MIKLKVLIAGGTGFIGFHIAKKLLKLGYEPTSLSTSKPKIIRKIRGVKYIKCDVTKKKIFNSKLKENFDYVINLSGYIDHSNKVRTLRSHYHGSNNLADFFLKKKIKLFIQIGSSLEYGNKKSPQHEASSCRPRSNYGLAKLKATKHLCKLGKKYNFPFIILRLYQIYGPNQTINRLIPIVISSCLKNKSFACTFGTQYRDYLYIDDLVDLICKILKNKKTKQKIYNVGSGKPFLVKKVIILIQKIIGKGIPLFGKILMRKDEIESLYPNINRVKKTFKWKPGILMKAGLKKTILSYEKNISK